MNTRGGGQKSEKLDNELLIVMRLWPETVTNEMKACFRIALETCKARTHAQTNGLKTNPSLHAAFSRFHCVLMVIWLVLPTTTMWVLITTCPVFEMRGVRCSDIM